MTETDIFAFKYGKSNEWYKKKYAKSFCVEANAIF